MYSVLAVDLDDTLLADAKTISRRNRDALAAWRGSGRRIVVATGRPPRATRTVATDLVDLPMICYNGAWIEQQNKVLFQSAIPVDDARRVVAAIQSAAPECRLGVEIADQLYLNHEVEWPGVCLVRDVLAHTDRPVAKILASLAELDAACQPSDGQVNSASPSETLLRTLPPSARALVSPKYDLVQVIPHSASKAAALRWLLERWGLSIDEVIAFGDDVNDVEMIAEAGLGVAMANAVPEVKAVADRITTSNLEDGVAAVLEELLD